MLSACFAERVLVIAGWVAIGKLFTRTLSPEASAMCNVPLMSTLRAVAVVGTSGLLVGKAAIPKP